MAFDIARDQADSDRFAMTIHWIFFGPGMLLLLFPADRLLSATIVLRTFERFRSLENSPRHRPWWWVPALWLDPVRALIGTLCLRRGLAVDSLEWTAIPLPPYSLLLGILAVAVFVQTFTRREEAVLLAPMGFVVGVVTALTSWPVALIGFALATAAVFAFRQFHAFFSVGFVTIAVLGLMFKAGTAWLAPAVGVLGLPLVACLVTGSTLELPTHHAAAPVRPPGAAS